ncbi:hypothetical protein DCAR_0310376 [Daucus carota subsp. sativus]|uniref:GIR1-like zinc ribbon domain-containing protein n=1 Tax=Daucus carota subsp. sativus TaxID=79200 RepID=A0AAF0WMG4_DAUCS|nr:hypothetical protein DCAR_0310376 [Daucus carota subsp. sativus]
MSRKNGNGQKLDLKLNLSPPTRNTRAATPSRSTVSPATPPISCVSSEANQEDVGDPRDSSSPEASSSSMVLAGCPRCLMYIMLSEEDPRCPKCGSTVLLDVLQDHNSSATTKNAGN